MNRLIQKKALRNAAKVAFGSLVLGCGGTISDGGTPDAAGSDALAKQDNQTPDVATLDVATIIDAPVSDAALACLGETGFDASVTPTEFQCCIALIEQDMGDAGWTTDDAAVYPPGAKTVEADPSSMNCCRAIIADVDQNTADYVTASPTLATCCSAAKGPMGPACTPWGPPMPPELVS